MIFNSAHIQSQHKTHFEHRYTLEDGLHNRIIKKVLRDQQGKFWIFSDEGIQLYTGSSFKEIPALDSLSIQSINEIYLSKDGPIYLIADEYYYIINTRTYHADRVDFNKKPLIVRGSNDIIQLGDRQNQITIDNRKYQFKRPSKSSMIWDNNLVTLDEEYALSILDKQGVVNAISNVSEIIGVLHDSLLFIKYDTLFKMDKDLNQTVLFTNTRRAVLRSDSLGQSLLGISSNHRRIKEMYLYSNGSRHDYTFLTEKYNTIIDFYGENFSNDILIGTYEGLIYQSFGNSIEQIFKDTKADSERLRNVIWWIIYREKEDALYFSKETGEIYRYQNSELSTVLPNKNTPNIPGTNYFGTYDTERDLAIISSFDSKPSIWLWDFKDKVIPIPTEFITYSFVKLNESQYLLGGKIKREDKNGEKEENAVIAILDLESESISAIAEVPDIGKSIYNLEFKNKALVASTNKGLFKIRVSIDRDSLKVIEQSNIYNSDFTTHLSIGNYILAGCFGKGLYLFKNDVLIKIINEQNGLVGNVINAIKHIDDKIWVSTDRGLSVLNTNFEIIKNIRKREGLSSLELNQSSFETDERHIYVGSINGVNKIHKSIADQNRKLAFVPEDVRYANEKGIFFLFIHDNNIQIPYGVDSFNVNIETYDLFTSPFNNDHLFKSEIELNNRTIPIIESSIPILQKTNSADLSINSSDYISNTVSINRNSFIKEYNVELFSACVLMLLLYYLYKLKERQLLENKEKEIELMQNKLEAMRSSALRSQMNPHFIFNALGSIQYHIQKEEAELAEEYLSSFAFLMRRILESSKEDYVKLSEEIEMLKAYVKLEHMRFNHKFDFNIHTDSSIDMSHEIPTMIIQPFIENAINHGLYHLQDRKGILSITFSSENDSMLLCEIDDNGVGRQAAKKLSNHKHKSRSMQIVNERMEILTNETDQRFLVNIIDKNKNDNPMGTTVKLSFGLN